MNKWLTESVNSTLRTPLQSRWHLLSSAEPDALDVVAGLASGIISGLTLACDANAHTVTVSAGQAVINGLVCTFSAPTIFSITAVYDSDLFYVVLQSVDIEDMTTNTFNKATWLQHHTTYSLALLSAADYKMNDKQLVLGIVRWEVTTSTVLVAGTAYPMRVLAVYNALDIVDTVAARALARIGDIVAVLALSYPETVGNIAVTLYELQYRTDPVRVPVTVSPGTVIYVDGMWVDNANYGTTSTKRKTVACLIDGVTLYPADADIPDTRMWTPILNTNTGLLAYLTSMPSYVADVLDYTDPATVETVPEIAAVASAIDMSHRYMTGNATSDFPGNPHKLSFNDINDSERVPLLGALFDEGFAIYGQTPQGVIGMLTTETTLGGDIKVDWFGLRTGIIGNRYIVTKHVPTSIAYVTNSDTAQEIPHQLMRDVVSLGIDFVGGTFSGYVRFAPRLSYSIGDLVTTTVANKPANASTYLRLWKCTVAYVGGKDTTQVDAYGTLVGAQASCFVELQCPTSVVVGYRYVADTEYETDPTGGSTVRIRQNTDIAILTQGHVLDPVQLTDYAFFNTFSLHSYLDLFVESMELMLTSDSEVVSSQAICDRAVLSDRSSSKWTASGTGTGNAIPVFATNRQVKLTCVNTPGANLYVPSTGSIAVTSTSTSNFYGRVKLLYVYGVHAESVSVLNRAGSKNLILDPNVGPFDTTNAKLVDSDETEIAQDYWQYDPTTQRVYISDSVYRSSTGYAFIRKRYESPRNLSGTITGTGTKTVAGVSATARVCIRDASRIAAGDSISISSTDATTGSTFTATKTAATSASTVTTPTSQFVIAALAMTTATNIAAAFNADPAFSDAGYLASARLISGRYNVVFTAPPGAQFNSNATVQVTCTGNGMSVAQSFSGGADHTWSFSDLAGMTVTITDAVPEIDCSAYWSVYSTGDLDSGYDESTFYRIGTIDASYTEATDVKTTKTYSLTVSAADVTGTLDSMSIADEFSCTVVVTGSDSTGTVVTDTLVIDRTVFADCTDPGKENDKRWIRMPDQVVTVSSWQVTDSAGLGSAELAVVAETGADAGPCYSICKLEWSGSSITAIQDARKIVTSNTRVIADAKAVGDALSHTCTLLGFTGGLT